MERRPNPFNAKPRSPQRVAESLDWAFLTSLYIAPQVQNACKWAQENQTVEALIAAKKETRALIERVSEQSGIVPEEVRFFNHADMAYVAAKRPFYDALFAQPGLAICSATDMGIFDCGLRIADCGLGIADWGNVRLSADERRETQINEYPTANKEYPMIKWEKMTAKTQPPQPVELLQSGRTQRNRFLTSSRLGGRKPDGSALCLCALCGERSWDRGTGKFKPQRAQRHREEKMTAKTQRTQRNRFLTSSRLCGQKPE